MKIRCEFVGGSMNGMAFPLELAELFSDGKSPNYSKDRARGACVPCADLDDRPTFREYLGPMWDGIRKDGTLVLRYETQDVYDLLSV